MLRRTQRGLLDTLPAHHWRHRARVPVTLSGWNLSAVVFCLILRSAGLPHCRVVPLLVRGMAHRPVLLHRSAGLRGSPTLGKIVSRGRAWMPQRRRYSKLVLTYLKGEGDA